MSLMGADQEIDIPMSRNCEDDEDSDDLAGDGGGMGGYLHPEGTVSFRLDPAHSAAPEGDRNGGWPSRVDALLVGVYGAGAAFLGTHFGARPVEATLRVGRPRSKEEVRLAEEAVGDGADADAAEGLGAAGRPVDVCDIRIVAADGATGPVAAVATFTRPLSGGPLSFDAAEALLGAFPSARRVLIADAFAAAQFRPAKGRPALNPPFARSLRNTAEKATEGSPAVKRAQLYDAPNVVGGMAARLLARCEAAGTAARWVGTAVGYEPSASCLSPLEAPVAEWAGHAASWCAKELPAARRPAPAALGGGEGDGVAEASAAAELSKRYAHALRHLAGAQLRKSHMFL